VGGKGFQSSSDPFMALRLMVYVGMLYQRLIENGYVKRGATS
jgi:hypothetical protein